MVWTGPHNHHPSNEITIPEIQISRALNKQELAVLPNTNILISEVLDVYCETVHSLKLLFNTTLLSLQSRQIQYVYTPFLTA